MIAAPCAYLGEFRIPVGRRAKIFTAEGAEGAETKAEGKRERIAIGRPTVPGWIAVDGGVKTMHGRG
jgi:hypothetical protein